MQGTHLLVLALFIVVASCLESRIELQTPTYSTGSELNLEWRLVHSTEQTIEFLRWGTPLEENWNANYFEIVHVETGSKATYAGRVVKRTAPSAQHYTKLSGVHQGTLNLATGYRFYSEGTYSITLAFTGVSKDGSVILVRSNTVEVLVENPDIREQTHRQERAIGFVGCSASEQSILLAAETNAQIGVDSLNLYMSQSLPPACSAEYVQWFGTYSDSNWDIIKNDFIAMIQLFRADAITFDCVECLGDPDYATTYAYVYTSDPVHTIHLCELFWSSPPGPYETDSQAGVIVHEASHFDDIAATYDYAYGQSLCMDLAIDDPDAAVDNADSHEYMMEGNPVCSVVGATSCGNGVCDFVETAVTCPEDCDGGAGGDPHLFSFDGEEIKLELPFQDGKFYSFFSSPIMQIVIRTTEREGAVLIDGVGIKIHQNQFLAILNADQDPEVYMNGNLVVHSTTTPFGMLEMFLPHPSDLVGPLAQFSRYVVSGIRIEDFFTVVAGYHPGFGGFFNLAVHQSHASSTGLLPTISRNQNLRDVTLDEFETSTFF